METGSVVKSLGQIHCRWRQRQPSTGLGLCPCGCCHCSGLGSHTPRQSPLGARPACRACRLAGSAPSHSSLGRWPRFRLFSGGDPGMVSPHPSLPATTYSLLYFITTLPITTSVMSLLPSSPVPSLYENCKKILVQLNPNLPRRSYCCARLKQA